MEGATPSPELRASWPRRHSARSYLRGTSPLIDCIFHPSRHRNGPDMTAFADEIHYRPMSLSNLKILNCQRRELAPAQSVAHEHRNHCKLARTAQIISVGFHE
jgi:hypothetical protein